MRPWEIICANTDSDNRAKDYFRRFPSAFLEIIFNIIIKKSLNFAKKTSFTKSLFDLFSRFTVIIITVISFYFVSVKKKEVELQILQAM